jgi:hypothetical protein
MSLAMRKLQMSPRPRFVLRDFLEGRQLLLELVIVFLGVYAAFWVDNYRESLAEQERSKEIAQAILRGLDDVIHAETSFIETSAAGLADWREARQRGESPPPFYFRVSGSERPPRTIYEAIIQSRPAELFDSELLFDLGYFYSEMVGVSNRYIRYAEFTESTLLPNLKRGAEVFYDADGESLRPEYEAHMDRLEELIQMWSDDRRRAQDLTERLSVYVE